MSYVVMQRGAPPVAAMAGFGGACARRPPLPCSSCAAKSGVGEFTTGTGIALLAGILGVTFVLALTVPDLPDRLLGRKAPPSHRDKAYGFTTGVEPARRAAAAQTVALKHQLRDIHSREDEINQMLALRARDPAAYRYAMSVGEPA